MPHPLEQLRYVARNWGAGDDLPAFEVASVLAELAQESPNMLLQACRRMIEYFPASGVAWWLSARALSAPDAAEGIWEAADELSDDPTPEKLAAALAPEAVVAISPLTSPVASALRRRGDVRTVKKLGQAGLLLMPVCAASPSSLLVTARAAQAARAAGAAGKPVWAVVPRGALLPTELWGHLLNLALPAGSVEALDASVVGSVVGDEGRASPAAGLCRPTCPPVAELRGWKS